MMIRHFTLDYHVTNFNALSRLYVRYSTLSSRAALGLPLYTRYHIVARASKGILQTKSTFRWYARYPIVVARAWPCGKCAREQRYLAYKPVKAECVARAKVSLPHAVGPAAHEVRGAIIT